MSHPGTSVLTAAMRSGWRPSRVAAALALLAVCASPAIRAAEFTAKATGNWNDTNTWNSSVTGTFPSAGDTVTIGNFNVTVANGVPAIFSGGTYSATAQQTLGLNSTLTLDSGTFAFRPNTTNSIITGSNGAFVNRGTFLLNFGGGGQQILLRRTGGTNAFVNEGIFAFQNAGTIYTDNQTNVSIVNSGTFAAINTSATAAFTASLLGSGNNVYFRNSGFVVADGTAARLSLGYYLLDTGGTIAARNGGILTLATGGTNQGHNTSASTVFSADGVNGSEVRLGGTIDQLMGTLSGTGVYLGSTFATKTTGTSVIDFGSQVLRWGGAGAQVSNLNTAAGQVMEFRSPVTYSPAGFQIINSAATGTSGGWLVNKSTLTLDGAELYLYGGRIVNSGTLLMRQGGIFISNPAIVENPSGSLIEAISGTTNANQIRGGGAAGAGVVNAGTIRANARNLDISSNFTDSGGRLEARDGGVLAFSGNTNTTGFSTSSSTVFSTNGTGTISLGGRIVQAVGTVDAGSNVRIGAITTGIASGTSFIDLGNTQIGWSSGTSQAANLQVSPGQVFEFRSPVLFNSPAQQLITPSSGTTGGSLVNKSTLTISTTSVGLYFQNATLDNTGTIRFAAVTGQNRLFNQGNNTPNSYLYNRAGGVIEATSGTGNIITIDSSTSAAIAATRRLFNSGTIRSNGGNLNVNAEMTNEAGGVLAANDGILRFTDPRTHNGIIFGDGIIFDPTTVLSTTPTGTISLGGYIGRLQGSITGSGTVVLGERFTGAANSYIDFGSTVLNWTASDTNSEASLTSGNVLEFRSPVSRTVNQVSENFTKITGTGTLKVAANTSLSFDGSSSAGNLRVRERTTFLNSGTLNAQINSGTLSAFDINVAGGTPTFVNEGLLRKTTSGTLRISGISGSGTAGTFSNTGTLEVVAGAGGDAALLTGSAAGTGLVFQQLTGGTMLTGGTYRAISSGSATATIGINSVANGAITSLGSGAAVYLEQTDTSGAQRALMPQLSSSSLTVNGRLTAMGTRNISITNVAVGSTGLLDGNGTFTGSFTTAAGGQISLSSGGLLASTGTLANDGVITLAGATLRPSAAIIGSGSIALAGQGTIDTAGFAIESSNAVTGAGSLVKTGAGRLRLSGASSYSGGGTVSAGALIFANRAAQPSSGTTTIDAGATLGVGVSASDGAYFDAAYLDDLFAGTAARVNNSSGVSNVGIDTTAGDFTYASNVSGSRGLVKYGPNVLTLGGANTFSGGTEVVEGSIRLTTATGLGTGTATLSGGTLDLNGQSIANVVAVAGGTLSGGTINTSQVATPTGAGRIAAVLSGAGFTKTGTGTLVLAGNNTYSGTTRIEGGILRVERATGSLPNAGAVTLAATAGLTIDNAGATGALSQSVGPLSFQAGAGKVTLVRTAGQDLALTASGVTVAAGATGNLVPGGGANSAANGFTIAGQATGFIDAGLYYDGSNFAWYDAGAFVRGINYGVDSNTRTTGTTSSNQTSIAHQQFTGNATGQTTGTFTTLAFTGSATAYTLSSGSVTVTGLLKSGTGTTTMSGGTGIRAPLNTDIDIRTDLASGTLAISHVIAANGSNGLTKSGAGTLSLGGANTFTGLTRPLEGTLVVGNASALQNSTLDLSAAGAGTVTFNQASTLGGLTGSRNLGFGGFAITVGNNGGSTSYSGSLSSGSLVKTGTGTLTLTGSSTLANATSINGGVVTVDWLTNSGQASPVGTAALINLGSGSTGGTLRYTGSGHTTDRAINLSGSTGGGGVIDAAGSGPLVLTGSVTTADGSKTLTLSGTSVQDNMIGAITKPTSGVLSVVKDGPGLWRLTGASDFNGGLTVRNGTVVAAASDGSSSTTAGVFGVDTGVTVGDTAAGATGTAALLAAASATIRREITVSSTGVGAVQAVLVGGASNSGTSTFNSTAKLMLGRDVALVATGGGAVTFENQWFAASGSGTPTANVAIGADGYTGIVRLLTSGTLATGGSIGVRYGTAVLGATTILDGAGTLAIDSGATLGGIGTVAGPLGGAGLVAPGNSPGILTAEAFDASGGLGAAFEFTSTAPTYTSSGASVNDVLRLTGTSPFLGQSLDGDNVVRLYLPASAASGGTFTGGFFTDTSAGSFANFLSTIQSGSYVAYYVSGSGAFPYNGQNYALLSDLSLQVQVGTTTVSGTTNFQTGGSAVDGQVSTFTVVVPEPATVALAGLGAALAAWRLRRRRNG